MVIIMVMQAMGMANHVSARIGQGMIHHRAQCSSPWFAHMSAMSLFNQMLVTDVMTHQQQRGRGLIIIKLRDGGGKKSLVTDMAIMTGKQRLIAIVASAAKEKNLNAAALLITMESKHIGILQLRNMHRLMRLQATQSLDAIPQQGGGFILLVLTGIIHGGGQFFPHVFAVTTQKRTGFLHQMLIIKVIDFAHTRRSAAFNLIQQTRTAAIVKHTVGTRTQ